MCILMKIKKFDEKHVETIKIRPHLRSRGQFKKVSKIFRHFMKFCPHKEYRRRLELKLNEIIYRSGTVEIRGIFSYLRYLTTETQSKFRKKTYRNVTVKGEVEYAENEQKEKNRMVIFLK